ncbi:MAG TPA: helix-turn-helix domain-containing protein [Propionibacteriaceae bacterium]
MTDVLPTTVIPDPHRLTARRAVTRDKLMSAAITVFADRGIRGASVEEICEAAGFTRGAFYSNFADKDALVLALIQQSIQSQYAAAEASVAELHSAPADLSPAELVSYVLTRFEAAGGVGQGTVLTQQEMLLHAAREPSLREPYLAFSRACTEQLATLLTGAMATARLEFTCTFDDAIQLLMAAHHHMQTQALFTGQTDSGLLHAQIMALTAPTV